MRIALGLAALSTSLLCGCSAHPFPEEVVGFDTPQIVDKIRCEAAEVVDAIFNERYGSAGLFSKADLAGQIDSYEEKEKAIKVDRSKLEKLEADATGLNARADQLRQRIRLYELKMEKAALDLLDAGADGRPEKVLSKRAEALRELIRRKNVQAIRFEKERMQLSIDVEAANARSKYFEAELSRKRKFLKETFKKLEEFLRHRFVYYLDLKITRKDTLSSDMSYRIPLPWGSVSIDQINPKREQENTSQRIVKAVASFGELLKVNGCGLIPSVDPLRARRYPIVGDVGLKEVIVQYMKIINDDDKINLKADKSTEAYSDKITFKTTISGGATPKIIINQTNGNTFTGNIGLFASRSDEHTLTAYLFLESEDDNGGKNDKDKPTRVEIVGGRLEVTKE